MKFLIVCVKVTLFIACLPLLVVYGMYLSIFDGEEAVVSQRAVDYDDDDLYTTLMKQDLLDVIGEGYRDSVD